LETSQRVLWIVWAALLASIALYVAIPSLVPPRAEPWYAAKTAVAGFVAGIFSLALAVGTFAIRESLARRHLRSGAIDPDTAEGFGRLRTALLLMWALCDAIAVIGLLIAVLAGSPALVLPYAIGAAALLFLHRPQPAFFARTT